jgi:hypothetical protein
VGFLVRKETIWQPRSCPSVRSTIGQLVNSISAARQVDLFSSSFPLHKNASKNIHKRNHSPEIGTKKLKANILIQVDFYFYKFVSSLLRFAFAILANLCRQWHHLMVGIISPQRRMFDNVLPLLSLSSHTRDEYQWRHRKAWWIRVARFFLVHVTKTGKLYQMNTKCTKWS